MKEERYIKKDFPHHFKEQMKKESFMDFFHEIFLEGSAYIVGGYIRDYLLDKDCRDIDIITDIANDKLMDIVESSKCSYSINRHKGIKIKLKTTEIDIWTIEDNWAFKNNLVKLNEKDILNSIAKGCFYNFDSLVINLHTYNYNLRYYKECINKKVLNILQEKVEYKKQNPSVEANIIRAIYLKKTLGLEFSKNTSDYIFKNIENIVNPISKIMEVKKGYNKYSDIEEQDIISFIEELKSNYPSLLIL